MADFAAGNGDLLQAAKSRWPECRILATDVDATRIRRLRRGHPDWLVGKCDFLSSSSRGLCEVLDGVLGKVSLVLLNPPFSCRGNELLSAPADGQAMLCSRAMAFVLTSIPFLSPTGRLAAVLPAGCLTSQKDAHAWQFLRRMFNVRVVSSHDLRTFEGCAARTNVVCLSRIRSGRVETRRTGRKRATGIAVKVIRGVVPVHQAVNGMAGPGWVFVHTTNLRNNVVSDADLSIKVLRRYATGPCVLIPRVGQPNREKCVLYLARKRVVLSDCIFAIKCESSADARSVQSGLLDAWDTVSHAYGGTCARYLTRDRLCCLLRELGFEASVEPEDGE